MKLYAITECYAWYKGADATHWGVFSSLEKAKMRLEEIIEEKFHYIKEDVCEDEDEWYDWVKVRYVDTDGSLVMWEDEDDDAITKFYIDETEID